MAWVLSGERTSGAHLDSYNRQRREIHAENMRFYLIDQQPDTVVAGIFKEDRWQQQQEPIAHIVNKQCM